MGVGDISIGKKMKPMLAAFYGRSQAYDKALTEGDAALRMSLGRNLYGSFPVSDAILNNLVQYVRVTIDALDQRPLDDLLSGNMQFTVQPAASHEIHSQAA